MWTVTVVVRRQTSFPVFQYTDHHRARLSADEAQPTPNDVSDPWFTIEDDFGRVAAVNRNDVIMVLMNDLEKSLAGDRAARLLQLQSEATLQKTAASDPLVLSAQRMMQMAGSNSFGRN